MLRLRRVSPNYRELFVARYDQLLAWALQISQGDRALAEDLLHDLYVLFTIHEPEIDPAQMRAPFRLMRRLFERLRENGHADLDTLSIGMSADLEAAIAEGATEVRVGTAIFGERSRA